MLERMYCPPYWDEELFEIVASGTDGDVKCALSNLCDFCRDGDGETILHRAIWDQARPSVIQLIIDAMGEVELRNRDDETPLILAAAHGNEEIVDTLLAAGANPDARDMEEQTALIKAAESNCHRIVQTLVRAGADCELTDRYGKTALTIAKDCGYPTIVKILARNSNGSDD